jgi:hypothetical protein
LLMVFSAVNNVLPSLQRLRGGAGGRAWLRLLLLLVLLPLLGWRRKWGRFWGSVDREGCFGCREEMAERGEWPGGGLFLGALSLSRSKNTPPLLVFQPPPRSTKLSSF